MWDSTGISRESIKNPHTSDVIFAPKIIGDYRFNSTVECKGIFLKQDSLSFLHKNIANLYILYELDTWPKDLNTDFTLGNCLFRAVKLTTNTDPDKYKYNCFGIWFDSRSQFPWSDGTDGKNIIILELIIVPLCILMIKTNIP